MDDQMRVSDADRERVTARLRDHFAEGRLTHDELDERVAAALSAKTFGELRRIMADLPEPVPLTPRGGPFPAAGRPYPMLVRRGPRLLPVIALLILGLALVSGGGAAVFLLKAVAVALTFMFVFLLVAAVIGGAFVRRIRKHWYVEHHQHAGWHRHWDSGNWRGGTWRSGDWPPDD
jgi:hypothetical protein